MVLGLWISPISTVEKTQHLAHVKFGRGCVCGSRCFSGSCAGCGCGGGDGPRSLLSPRGQELDGVTLSPHSVTTLTQGQASWAVAATQPTALSRELGLTHTCLGSFGKRVCTETRTGEGLVSACPGLRRGHMHRAPRWPPDLTPGPGTDRTSPRPHHDFCRLSIYPFRALPPLY